MSKQTYSMSNEEIDCLFEEHLRREASNRLKAEWTRETFRLHRSRNVKIDAAFLSCQSDRSGRTRKNWHLRRAYLGEAKRQYGRQDLFLSNLLLTAAALVPQSPRGREPGKSSSPARELIDAAMPVLRDSLGHNEKILRRALDSVAAVDLAAAQAAERVLAGGDEAAKKRIRDGVAELLLEPGEWKPLFRSARKKVVIDLLCNIVNSNSMLKDSILSRASREAANKSPDRIVREAIKSAWRNYWRRAPKS